ncbi:uncharacterized protein B0P05DRAFT_521149 [Gilbertella persicaria]|uniref:uncharacterized protein n=1 Tax=Gilbertella persicaria TaxID=101096 RepID=UPI00221F992E|nr:uncharacterized protein B0P05DRAFT_521149 [Gilbertella persicaria]KAI8098270.1 hypothetical protein B0P05DRAFT_521149 [Gilbertella persicaria]
MSDENAVDIIQPESVKTSSPILGKLKVRIFSSFLNVKVKKAYVVITLGDQRHQTSISEARHGQWQESFDFIVSFHAQLFGTIQMDLYESFAIYPDKHIGRAEIRLNTLVNMPETFSSYYEIWDKKLSTGASSSIGRERAAVNNRGALHVEISYSYLRPSDIIDQGKDLEEIMPTPKSSLTNLLIEELSEAEFKRHLQFQRERRKTGADISFKQYEESNSDQSDAFEDDSDDDFDSVVRPLKMNKSRSILRNIDDDEEFGEMVAAPQPNTVKRTSSWFSSSKKQEDKKDWTDTSQVIKAIGKLLAIFGQGFELTNMQVLTGFTVLDKFYTDMPRNRTWDLVENLSEIDMGARFWKFSIASYGWKGLNFIGQGNGIFSDAMREHSDAKSILEYLIIPKEDLLAYEFRSTEAFRPSYFIARDRFTNSIVLSIRGTMSVMDTLTDLVCEYEPWKGGFIHSGMKFFRHVVPQLVAYSNEHSTTGLVIVGHSLGAATAAILTIILMDCLDEFRKGKEEFSLKCYCYAPACGLSLDLAEKYKDIIQSFVFADDIVSKLSYGSVMDVKELIIASTEAVRNMGVSEILWSSKLEGEKWKAAFEQIEQVRKRCFDAMENPRLYVAGQIYQFWLDPTPSNDTRIVVEKTTASKVCDEVVVRKSIILDHLPTNFDVAFKRARETLMMEGCAHKKGESLSGVLDPVSLDKKEEIPNHIWDAVAKLGLKGTTDRTGGEGKAVGENSSR